MPAVKFPALYGMSVGVLILGQWAFFLATGAVPELHTAPWSIGFHLAAEFLMAAALIAGGVAIWRSRKWGGKVLLTALGMAIYSEIVSPGYFAQQGTWGLVAMFAVLLAGALIGVRALNIETRE
jgi:hypothetical protein